MEIYTPLIERAVRFAVETHEVYQKQKRKGKDIPYITHPLTVGLILARAGASEKVVAAGILHDTIEDSIVEHEVTREALAEKFGDEVAAIVESVSETDRSLPWVERKQAALERIAGFSQDSLLVKSADVLSNGSELVDDHERDGDSVFDRFNASKQQVLGHYLRIVGTVIGAWPENPMAEELKTLARKVQMMGAPSFMMEHRAPIVGYYDYDENWILQCPLCHWTGSPKESGWIEHYDELMDVSCPICEKMLLIVEYPTAEEIKEQVVKGNKEATGDYMGVLAREAYNKRFEDRKLKSPEQLPEIPGEKLDFDWDYEELPADDLFKSETVLRHEAVVLWREPALWEGWPRFNQVRGILKQRYGNRFNSLTPSTASELFLYGDDLSAPGKLSVE